MFEIRHGDAIDLLDDVKDGSVPLLLTDPPYWTAPAQYIAGRTRPHDHRSSLSNLSLIDRFYRDFFDALIPKMSPAGTMYIFGHMAECYPVYFVHLFGRVRDIRLLTWDRGTTSSGDTWTRRTGQILFATMYETPAIQSDDPDYLDVPEVPPAQKVHPGQKPLDLLVKLIEKSSKPGDLVLDPFAGSGATGVAAKRCGRDFLGFELNPLYFADAQKMLAAVTGDERK